MIEADGKWRFITSLSKWAFGSLSPRLWVIHSVFAYMTASTQYMYCVRAHSCTLQQEETICSLLYILSKGCVYHGRDIFQILFMPGCDADAGDSVFQAHSWLCVNWKSTASDLLCPLNRLSVNLASSLHHLRYTPTACPRERFRHGQYSIFTFSQHPHYCAQLPTCTKLEDIHTWITTLLYIMVMLC